MITKVTQWPQSVDVMSLISDLKDDISCFGENLIVDVTAEDIDNVIIYRNYQFADEDDPELKLVLKPQERIEQMLATKLLEIYQQME